MEKMQAQARKAVYWHSINAAIAYYIRRCTICTKEKASPLAQPMLPQDIPNGCGRRLQLPTSSTKAKSTYSSAICLESTPSYLRYHPNQPIPFSKSSRNSYPSMDHPATSILTIVLPLHLMSSCSSYNNTSTIPPLPHTPPKSNRFIKRQVKILNTTLSTIQDTGKSIEDLLLDLWSTPIGPKMFLPREILHNRMSQCPGKPSTTVDMEHICNHLLAKRKARQNTLMEPIMPNQWHN